MYKLILLISFALNLFALETSDRLFDCTEIFQERKSELLVELERIDEQKQALNSLKVATEDLLNKKEMKLQHKESEVNNMLEEIKQKEQNIQKLLEKNEQVLQEIKELKMDKVAQTFSKMKAGAASDILSGMEPQEALKILNSLKPKTVGAILAKMQAQKASELTSLLSK